MALIALRQLLDHAADHGYGVPAFNVNNLEQIHAIMQAAQATDSPVILQASAGARKYAGEAYLRHMVLAAIETHPDIPVCLHQDHGASPAVCIQAIRSGFSSVMMDGSLLEDAKTPASYDYNVAVTAKVCEMAHAVGVSVEGELGCLGSLETGDAGEEDGVGAAGKLSHDQMLTDPAEARDFVERTGVDALAIAIGTSHGAYKFTRPPTGEVLAIDRIAQIHAAVPDTHLVMHGSSSVPQDYGRAVSLYREAIDLAKAEQKDMFKNGSAAKCNLADKYEHGVGVPQNYKQALYWYMKSAEQENCVAQYSLGNMYKDGRGVPQDLEQARTWFAKSAAHGYEPAQIALENMSNPRGD